MAVLNKMLDQYGATEIAADIVLRMAFERGFEIVSEASRHVPKELKAMEPEIDWTDIAGIGNILRHDYDRVKFDILIGTSSVDFPKLSAALHRMLVRLPPL
jgi:uncharacterized protein with HEPN domain